MFNALKRTAAREGARLARVSLTRKCGLCSSEGTPMVFGRFDHEETLKWSLCALHTTEVERLGTWHWSAPRGYFLAWLREPEEVMSQADIDRSDNAAA